MTLHIHTHIIHIKKIRYDIIIVHLIVLHRWAGSFLAVVKYLGLWLGTSELYENLYDYNDKKSGKLDKINKIKLKKNN